MVSIVGESFVASFAIISGDPHVPTAVCCLETISNSSSSYSFNFSSALSLLHDDLLLVKAAARLLQAFYIPVIYRVCQWGYFRNGEAAGHANDGQLITQARISIQGLGEAIANVNFIIGHLCAYGLSSELSARALCSEPAWSLLSRAGSLMQHGFHLTSYVLMDGAMIILAASSSYLAAMMDDLVCSVMPSIVSRRMGRRCYDWSISTVTSLVTYLHSVGSWQILLSGLDDIADIPSVDPEDFAGNEQTASPVMSGVLGHRYSRWISGGTSGRAYNAMQQDQADICDAAEAGIKDEGPSPGGHEANLEGQHRSALSTLRHILDGPIWDGLVGGITFESAACAVALSVGLYQALVVVEAFASQGILLGWPLDPLSSFYSRG